MAKGHMRVPDLKKIVFSVITIVVIPVLFFALLELGLTVFGVGTSYDYFHKMDIDGESYYQENPDFADQFYPKSLDIDPRENTFAVVRDPELIRVYVLGGSAALGFPHKNHGVDRLLDMTRTVVNITGDCTVTTIVAKSEGELDMAVFADPEDGVIYEEEKG